MSLQNRRNLITIVLPLWDREAYTPTWIKENLFDDFDYLIADGSKADANRGVFSMLNDRANVKYIRYPFDANIKDYVGKMLDAVSQVATPYVMTCDNDDFLNYSGVVDCINALEQNRDFGFSNGFVRSVTGLAERASKSRRYYRLKAGKLNTADLADMDGVDAIRKLFRPYRYVWYAIYRTHLYRKIWNEISCSRIDNVFLIEYLQAQLAFCLARLYAVNRTHYIRLTNPASNTAGQFAPESYPSMHGIYFDENYRAQVLKMGEIVASRLGLDKQGVYAEYRQYYGNHNRPDRLRTQIANAMYGYLFNIVSLPLDINTIRKMV